MLLFISFEQPLIWDLVSLLGRLDNNFYLMHPVCPIRLSKPVKTEKQRGKPWDKDYAAGPGICRSGRIVRIYPAGTRPFGIQCGYKSIWTIWHIAYICPLIHVKYSEAGRMNKTKSHFKLIKRSRKRKFLSSRINMAFYLFRRRPY